jgi:hypothetical protein
VHPGAPTRKHCGTIRNNFAVARDDPQQGGFISALPAAETSSYWFHTRPTHQKPLPAPEHTSGDAINAALPRLLCMTTLRAPTSTVTLSAALDGVLVLVFVALGRQSHNEGITLLGTAETAWPFLIGLAVGWVLTRAWRNPLGILLPGTILWACTLVIGMLLRVVSSQGVALPFVIVATVTLALFLIGWRALAAGFRRIRPRRAE